VCNKTKVLLPNILHSNNLTKTILYENQTILYENKKLVTLYEPVTLMSNNKLTSRTQQEKKKFYEPVKIRNSRKTNQLKNLNQLQ
jgi:hypothetical protein